MARKDRDITIKVIENKKINTNRLAEFFARKYNERNMKETWKINRKKKDIPKGMSLILYIFITLTVYCSSKYI